MKGLGSKLSDKYLTTVGAILNRVNYKMKTALATFW